MKSTRHSDERRQHKRGLRSFAYDKSQQHHCPCCGEDYRGNYCPACGLPTGKGPVNWHSIKEGVMDLWGLGSRSLPHTLWQLILRPGHLIAAYISGRRQVSFPPVKMLVIMALLALLINKLIFDENTPVAVAKTGDVESTINYYLDVVFGWAGSHYDWACLVFMSLIIVPTWVVFRHAPRCTRHNLPQGFFIQVFNSVQMLIIITTTTVVTWAIDIFFNITLGSQETSDNIVNSIVIVVIVIMIFRTYYQLFGYNAWGTAWRVVAVAVAGFGLLGVVIALFKCAVAASMGEWNYIATHLLTNLFMRRKLEAVNMAESLKSVE